MPVTALTKQQQRPRDKKMANPNQLGNIEGAGKQASALIQKHMKPIQDDSTAALRTLHPALGGFSSATLKSLEQMPKELQETVIKQFKLKQREEKPGQAGAGTVAAAISQVLKDTAGKPEVEQIDALSAKLKVLGDKQAAKVVKDEHARTEAQHPDPRHRKDKRATMVEKHSGRPRITMPTTDATLDDVREHFVRDVKASDDLQDMNLRDDGNTRDRRAASPTKPPERRKVTIGKKDTSWKPIKVEVVNPSIPVTLTDTDSGMSVTGAANFAQESLA